MVGAVTHVKSNAIADFTGIVTVFNSQGSTVTANATEIVRPSDWNSAHAQLATLSGNTAGASTISGTNIVVQGGNLISVSGAQGANAATIVVSAGNYITTARASTDAIGLNTAQSNVTWTVNSAGVSLDARGYAGTGTTYNGAGVSGSLTANSNGIQLSVSVTQSNQAVSAANGSYAFQTLSFSNANGLSFGTSAGSAITASHNAITTARASNDAIGLNTAQSNATWTVNSSGLSLDARGYAGTGTTFNGANISGSMTVNSNGVQLSASVAAPGGGLTQLSAYAVSNTTQSISGTIPLSALSFAGAGIASVGVSNGSVIVSVPAGGGAGDGGVFAGVSTGGNTLGSTGTVSTGNFVLVGSNGITLSQSTGAAGSAATITLLGPQRTISNLAIQPFAAAGIPFAQSSISLGQNSLYVYPFQLEDHLTVDHVKMPVLLTNSSTAVASIQKGYTYRFGLFTRVNDTQISQLYSTSYTMACSHNSNASWMLSIITAIQNSTSYNTLSASSAGLNLSASLHGPRELIMPMSTLLTPGEYWAAILASTSTVGGAGAILNISNLAVALQTYNRPGLSTATSNRAFYNANGMGVYSVTTGAMPASINMTQINLAGTQPILFLGSGTV